MQHFYKDLHGWFNFPLLYKDVVNTFDSGATFIEIGTWKGKSAAYMAVEIINSNKNIEFYCIDTWDGVGTYNHYDFDEDVKNKVCILVF